MTGNFPISSLKAFVTDVFEPHASGVKGGCLLSVAYPESNVVEVDDLSERRTLSLLVLVLHLKC